MDSIRKLIADDKRLIVYRPSLREIGGSVTGTILLQQIIYWDHKNNGKFFKFSSACDHEQCKPGDSWQEELGMSPKELKTALSKFAFKCGKASKSRCGESYKADRDAALVRYYTDSDRITWYELNRELLSKLLLVIYKENDEGAVIDHSNRDYKTEIPSGGSPDGSENDQKLINSAEEEAEKKEAAPPSKEKATRTKFEDKEFKTDKGEVITNRVAADRLSAFFIKRLHATLGRKTTCTVASCRKPFLKLLRGRSAHELVKIVSYVTSEEYVADTYKPVVLAASSLASKIDRVIQAMERPQSGSGSLAGYESKLPD